MAQHLVALFKYGVINETVCRFFQARVRNSISNPNQNTNEFPLLEKRLSLLPMLYQKLLTNGHLYDDLRMNDHARAITNILHSVALAYRNTFEMILKPGKRIHWWIDVASVNRSGIMEYFFCRFVGKIGSHSDLKYADLRTADLFKADLSGADLSRAALRRADLRGANLRRAKLRWADLRGAYLHRAHLGEADLYGALLQGTNLYRAGLREANLSGAALIGADLSGAYLNGANLKGANLRWALLKDGFRKGNQDEQIEHLKSLNIPDLKL